MKAEKAVSHKDLVEALPDTFTPLEKANLEDDVIEWLDGKDFYFVSVSETKSGNYNFKQLPEPIRAVLVREFPDEFLMVYLDR